MLPYNDLDLVRAGFEEAGDAIACVITEAAAANMGVVPPLSGFNAGLAELCRQYGALLISDEVMTGFRVTASGWYGHEGVAADLFTFGKVMGGGLPAAAFGGRADVMAHLAPAGPVYQAGTLSGNPLAVAAALASFEMLDDAAYLRLNATTTALAEGLREAAGDRPVHVEHTCGLLTVFFHDGPVRSYADAQACDHEGYGAWCRALLARGVYPPPSQYEAWFPSLAHTSEHVERTVEAAAAAFAELDGLR